MVVVGMVLVVADETGGVTVGMAGATAVGPT
jgi:hypothetical protein